MLLLAAGSARAAEVPPELGLLVVLKVLTYDAGFEQRVGSGAFLVLIPYEPDHAEAAKQLARAASALPVKSMVGRDLHFEALPSAELELQLMSRHAAAVLIPGATEPEAARAMAAVAAKRKRYSVTLNEDLVKTGITVGVALNHGKAQVVLNVGAAKGIGAEFAPVVMKVARLHQ